MNQNNNYDECSSLYSNLDLVGSGTIYLSFRDVPFLIRNYLKGLELLAIKAVDYGCGAGRSTRFLKHIGIEDVYGIDVNSSMLEKAREADLEGRYNLIEDENTNLPDNYADLVFSSFVLVEIGNLQKIEDVLKEVERILKPKGAAIFVSTSRFCYEQNFRWISYDQNFSENVNLKSGDSAKLVITDIGLSLRDYFWLESDIINAGEKANLRFEQLHFPTGKRSDGIDYLDEKTTPPYALFVFTKG